MTAIRLGLIITTAFCKCGNKTHSGTSSHWKRLLWTNVLNKIGITFVRIPLTLQYSLAVTKLRNTIKVGLTSSQPTSSAPGRSSVRVIWTGAILLMLPYCCSKGTKQVLVLLGKVALTQATLHSSGTLGRLQNKNYEFQANHLSCLIDFVRF